MVKSKFSTIMFNRKMSLYKKPKQFPIGEKCELRATMSKVVIVGIVNSFKRSVPKDNFQHKTKKSV